MKERGAATVSINVSILMGRLTHEPELRHTKDGTAVCNFCIAADLGFGDSKRTSYVDCVAWRGQAEFVSKYFTKGQMMAVSGYIQTGSFTDRNGSKRKSVEVVAEKIEFAGGKERTVPQVPIMAEIPLNLDGDDLPFDI